MEVINVLTGLILVGLVNYTLGNFGSIHIPNMSKWLELSGLLRVGG